MSFRYFACRKYYNNSSDGTTFQLSQHVKIGTLWGSAMDEMEDYIARPNDACEIGEIAKITLSPFHPLKALREMQRAPERADLEPL
jgi:hypothetical protein